MEVAASKNVSRQQLIDVIAKTQVDRELEGAVISEKQLSQMVKGIEPKVIDVIEHKSETPLKKEQVKSEEGGKTA